MDRSGVRRGAKFGIVGLLLAALGFSITGCGLVANLLYVADNRDVKAEFNGLDKKRVAVICHTEPSLKYTSNEVPRQLAMYVSAMLKEKLKKSHIIDQHEVDRFADENSGDDFVQVGKALNADMVVALDLKSFSLNEGQTLLRGKAKIHLAVYDIKDGGKNVFDKPMPEALYPPSTPMPAVDKPLDEFQRQFVMMLADQVGRYFYDHDSTVDFASDSSFYHAH